MIDSLTILMNHNYKKTNKNNITGLKVNNIYCNISFTGLNRSTLLLTLNFCE